MPDISYTALLEAADEPITVWRGRVAAMDRAQAQRAARRLHALLQEALELTDDNEDDSNRIRRALSASADWWDAITDSKVMGGRR